MLDRSEVPPPSNFGIIPGNKATRILTRPFILFWRANRLRLGFEAIEPYGYIAGNAGAKRRGFSMCFRGIVHHWNNGSTIRLARPRPRLTERYGKLTGLQGAGGQRPTKCASTGCGAENRRQYWGRSYDSTRHMCDPVKQTYLLGAQNRHCDVTPKCPNVSRVEPVR